MERDLSKLMEVMTDINSSLHSADTGNIKSSFENLKTNFPDFSEQLGGMFEEVKKGKLRDVEGLLQLPNSPTNFTPVDSFQDWGKVKVRVESFDTTESISLSYFRELLKKNSSTPNVFIATNIEEDDKFIKCTCPRCNRSSFLKKSK